MVARPKQEQIQSEHIGFRLFPKDRETIESKATKAGLQVSEYCRTIALKGKVIVHEAPKIPEVNRDSLEYLRSIALSINQIAKRVNTFGHLNSANENNITDRMTLEAMEVVLQRISAELGGVS